MTREPIPNRRGSLTFDFECDGHCYSATVSRYADGRLAEIFLNTGKPNTPLQSNAENCAILASLALQSGLAIDQILHSTCGPIAAALKLAVTA